MKTKPPLSYTRRDLLPTIAPLFDIVDPIQPGRPYPFVMPDVFRHPPLLATRWSWGRWTPEQVRDDG
jgi:hypothetical protein